MAGRGTDSLWIFNADACAPRGHASYARLPKDGEKETMSRLPESAIDKWATLDFLGRQRFILTLWWRTGKLVRLTSTECS